MTKFTLSETHNLLGQSLVVRYPYTLFPIACQSTFTLTVVDPCLSTVILTLPSSVENFVAFAGYSVASKARYTFKDSISTAKTLTTDSNDFCGEKQLKFELNSTIVSYLNGSNSNFFLFSPFANTTDFGVASASVYAIMKNHPSIESSKISFTATILGT